MRLGERVLNLLEEQHRKQLELALHLRVPPSTVNGWRQGNRNPSSDLILPICEFFNISVEYLLTGHEKSPSSSLREDELDLLAYYNALPEREQGKLLGQLAEQTKGAITPREGSA